MDTFRSRLRMLRIVLDKRAQAVRSSLFGYSIISGALKCPKSAPSTRWIYLGCRSTVSARQRFRNSARNGAFVYGNMLGRMISHLVAGSQEALNSERAPRDTTEHEQSSCSNTELEHRFLLRSNLFVPMCSSPLRIAVLRGGRLNISL